MVVIPAGRFHMGCILGSECNGIGIPAHEVVITRSFAISKYEVTFEDYDRYSNPIKVDDEGWGRGRRPVINIAWDEAVEYAAWLSAQTGEKYRLPTEAEWEYAAQADSSTRYSWGDAIGRNRANCGNCGSQWDAKRTAPVGSFAANAWGLHDMHGNVLEWMQDCWNESYAGAPGDGSAWTTGDCSRRVVRGGSWRSHSRRLRSADRYWSHPSNLHESQGFRIVRDM